jgi:PAS domain S-box-containing protein
MSGSLTEPTSILERISDHKQNKVELSELADLLPEIVFEIDLKGRFTFVNQKGFEITGYTQKDFTKGLNILQVLVPEDRDRIKGNFKRVLKGERASNNEYTILKKDGTTLPVVVSSIPIIRNNTPVGVRGIALDITERKIAEKELRESEEKFKNLAEQSPNMIFINKGGKVVYANKKAAETMGYKKEEFYSPDFNFMSLIVPESKELIKSSFNSHMNGKDVPSVEYKLVTKEGRIIDAILTTKLIMYNGEPAILGTITDISECRKMEDALRASEENYRNISKKMSALMKSSAMLIHMSDLRDQLRTIVDAVCEQGWARAVISLKDENLNTTDLVTAGLTPEEEEHLRKHQASGEVWRQLLSPMFKHYRLGESYYLPWSDPLVRKQFKNAIRSKVSKEETVDWNPDDLLFVPLRLPDGQVVGIMSIDDPKDGRRPTKESLAPLELFAHQAAVAIENAKLIQHLNEVKNELKEYADRLEEKVEERTTQLKHAQQQLLKSERLAAIGELAAMVGHDLRNPLTGIAGAAYYLKTKYGPRVDDKGVEMLQIIEKDIEYSNKIINDLLEYSREIKLELDEASPKSILKKALSSLKVPKNIRVVDRTQEKLRIRIDKEKMRRVFVNMIKNAIDAMPKGGTLTVRSKASNGNLEIIFSDTGVGMSKETLEKMWRPLFTTKAKGMGFGLPICKRLVEAHGGRISVKSTVGKGSAFTVSIPMNSL